MLEAESRIDIFWAARGEGSESGDPWGRGSFASAMMYWKVQTCVCLVSFLRLCLLAGSGRI